MPQYLVAVGGTGQHLALVATRLKAMGVLPPDLEAIVFDPDAHQGLTTLLHQPWKGASVGSSHPLLRRPVAAPFNIQGPEKFVDIFVQSGDRPEEQALFEGFFTETEANIPIREGMFGTPCVGATVISDGHASPQMRDALATLGNADRVFVCGSITGGTGAGIMHKLIQQIRMAHGGARIHGIFLTQWLDLPAKGQITNEILRRNQQHGLQFIFDHTIGKDWLSNALVVGLPQDAKGSSLLKRSAAVTGGETVSFLPLVAMRGIADLPAKYTHEKEVKAWGCAHNTEDQGWILDAKWTEKGPTLRGAYHAMLASRFFFEYLTGRSAEFQRSLFPKATEVFTADKLPPSLKTAFEHHTRGRERDERRRFVAEVCTILGDQLDRVDQCKKWLVQVFGSEARLLDAKEPRYLRSLRDWWKGGEGAVSHELLEESALLFSALGSGEILAAQAFTAQVIKAAQARCLSQIAQA